MTNVGTKQPLKLAEKKASKALDYFGQEEWRINMKSYEAKKDRVADNLAQGYAILWDQCKLPLKEKIRAHHNCLTAKDENDVITLLNINLEICNSTSTVTHYTS